MAFILYALKNQLQNNKTNLSVIHWFDLKTKFFFLKIFLLSDITIEVFFRNLDCPPKLNPSFHIT